MSTLPTLTAEVAFGLESQEVGDVAGLVLDGTGDYADTPDHADFDITGDVDLVWRGVTSDWTGAIQAAVGKWDETANECSYLLGFDASGNLAFYFSTDGSTVTTETGAAPPGGFVADRPYWVRATIDVNDGSSNRIVTFYYSEDVTNDPTSVVWQILQINKTATTVTLNSGSAKPTVGSTDDEVYEFTGTVYCAEIRDGIGGTAAGDPDFFNDTDDPSDTSFADTAGKTWTLRGDAAFAQAWYDVSSYVRSGSVRRGRQEDLDQFEAGRCTLVLDNRDRRFDPLYTSSPYSPNVVPEKRLRLKATWDSTTYDLFEGFVDGWPQSYPGQDVDSLVEVTAHDAFEVLGLVELQSPWFEAVEALGPSHWWPLGEGEGTVAYDRLDPDGSGTYKGGPTFNSASSIVATDANGATAFDVTDNAQWVELPRSTDLLPQTNTYTYSFWFQRPDGVTGDTENIWYWYGTTGETWTEGDTYLDRVTITTLGEVEFKESIAGTLDVSLKSAAGFDDDLPHHVVVVRDGGDFEMYVDGTSVAADTTTIDPSWVPADTIVTVRNHRFAATIDGVPDATPSALSVLEGSLQHMVLFDGQALTAAQVLNLYNAGANGHTGDATGARIGRFLDAAHWPTTKRNVDTGDTTVRGITSSPGSALDATQAIAETEAGALYVDGTGKVRFRERHGIYETTASNTSQATFGDSGSEFPYVDIQPSYDDTTLYNEIHTARADGLTHIAADKDSQRKYQRRVHARTNLETDNELDAEQAGNWLLTLRKNPVFRVDQIVVDPQRDPTNLYPEVLGRLIDDRITVKRRPQALGSAIDKDVWIQGVTHDWTPQTWRTTWDLTNAEDVANVLVLDHATFGELDANILAW